MTRNERVAQIRAQAAAEGNEDVVYLCDHFPHKLYVPDEEEQA